MQNPSSLILLEPDNFGYNAETAHDNHFQNKPENDDIARLAKEEHLNAQDILRQKDIEIHILKDSEEGKNPDATFLNNWFNVTPDKNLILYPMWAKNRQKEVTKTQVSQLLQVIEPKSIVDLRGFIKRKQYCEGTGALIFDYENDVVYSNISQRSNEKVVNKVAEELGFDTFSFKALDQTGREIYHTNVMLSIGENIIICCDESIDNEINRIILRKKLEASNREYIQIGFRQMENFCGNVFEVNDKNGNPVLIMSETAYNNFNEDQLQKMKRKVELVTIPIPTIEKVGGGSLRCLVAACY